MKNHIMDLITFRCTYWKEQIYCIARDFNLLFSINVQSGTISLIDSVPDENIMTSFLCGFMTFWNNKLIFAPSATKKIWLYDLTSMHWDCLTTKELEHCIEIGGFQQIHVHNNRLFFVGRGYPAILSLDLENKSLEYIETPYKDMIARHPQNDYQYFGHYGVKIENTLFLVSFIDNYVLKFNLDTLQYNWIKIGSDSQLYVGITWDGNNFWISPRSGSDIVKWDGRDNIKQFPLPESLKKHSEYTWGACYDGKQVILPAFSHDNTILIDITNDTMQIQKQQYAMFSQLDNGMIVSQTTDGNLSVQNGDSVHTYKLTVDTDQLNDFYKKKNLPVFKGQNLYYEGAKNSISSLESFLALTKSASEHKPATEGQIGKAIWEAIR